jgi:hypothetical protein
VNLERGRHVCIFCRLRAIPHQIAFSRKESAYGRTEFIFVTASTEIHPIRGRNNCLDNLLHSSVALGAVSRVSTNCLTLASNADSVQHRNGCAPESANAFEERFPFRGRENRSNPQLDPRSDPVASLRRPPAQHMRFP